MTGEEATSAALIELSQGGETESENTAAITDSVRPSRAVRWIPADGFAGQDMFAPAG